MWLEEASRLGEEDQNYIALGFLHRVVFWAAVYVQGRQKRQGLLWV